MNQPLEPKKESGWELIRTFLFALLLAMVFRSCAFEPFHIPSGSMRGTLLEGDYIFVSKPSYGYSRYSFPFGLPLFEGRLLRSEPQRGDVVVFRLPTNTSVDYIKRIVGLPGDELQVKNGQLWINGKAVEHEKITDYIDESEEGTTRAITQYRETLPNGVSYNTLDYTRFGDADNTDRYTVPEGHYFMMGDNRDNSIDSRFIGQVGFVPEENLIGHAKIIVFSFDANEARIWEFWRWPFALRTSRFFQSIH